MKAKLLISVLLVMMAYAVYAQDYSSYLNKAMEKLEAGDCGGAQNLYNVYKELSGKSMSSVEVLLADCNQEKTVSVGDSITVGNVKYQVAYVRDGGKHGLAIRNMGWGAFDEDYLKYQYVTQRGIPTLDEMRLIYANRDILRMYDIYWTCTYCSKCTASGYYYVKNFSTEVENTENRYKPNAVVLLIHRF